MPSEEQSLSRSSVGDRIGSINATAVLSVEDAPDSKTRLEKYEIGEEYAKQQIRSLSQDIDERKKYAHRIFCLICCWLGVCFLTLILEGFARWTQFSLTQGVLLAVIGSTSADVLGVFYIVTHYLFPQNATQPNSEDSDRPAEDI
jgi:hypothetical protein